MDFYHDGIEIHKHVDNSVPNIIRFLTNYSRLSKLQVFTKDKLPLLKIVELDVGYPENLVPYRNSSCYFDFCKVTVTLDQSIRVTRHNTHQGLGIQCSVGIKHKLYF